MRRDAGEAGLLDHGNGSKRFGRRANLVKGYSDSFDGAPLRLRDRLRHPRSPPHVWRGLVFLSNPANSAADSAGFSRVGKCPHSANTSNRAFGNADASA